MKASAYKAITFYKKRCYGNFKVYLYHLPISRSATPLHAQNHAVAQHHLPHTLFLFPFPSPESRCVSFYSISLFSGIFCGRNILFASQTRIFFFVEKGDETGCTKSSMGVRQNCVRANIKQIHIKPRSFFRPSVIPSICPFVMLSPRSGLWRVNGLLVNSPSFFVKRSCEKKSRRTEAWISSGKKVNQFWFRF